MADELVQIQDNVREIQLCTLFDLRMSTNRLGPDAYDENDNPFELKTTTQNGVGTGRDVSFEMIQEWRQRYWVIAKGRNLKSGFDIDIIYFLDPQMMDGAFKKIEDHMSPDIQLRDKTISLIKKEMNTEETKRLHYLITRGSTLNNPKISWKYVQENGVIIKGNYAKELRRLVKQYPLIKRVRRGTLASYIQEKHET
jgi:hypothetical protein